MIAEEKGVAFVTFDIQHSPQAVLADIRALTDFSAKLVVDYNMQLEFTHKTKGNRREEVGRSHVILCCMCILCNRLTLADCI